MLLFKCAFTFIVLQLGTILIGQAINSFYVGHSLSDQIPDMVKSLATDHPDVSFDWRYQSIPGAPLRWQWERKDAQDYNPSPPHIFSFYHAEQGLPSAQYDVLILTESVPRNWGPWGIEETYEYADSFYVYATQFKPDLRIYIYEVWHCLQSGTPTGCDYDTDSNPWRQRLTDDLPMWESAVDYLNDKFEPINPVCLIPAGQGLAKLYDEILLGTIPGISSMEDLFVDDIHLSDVGKYFVACIHFAMLFNKSPVGLTNQLQVWWGGDFSPPTPALAFRFQEIAWETVTEYPNSCLGKVTSTLKSGINPANNFSLFPNPVGDKLHISRSNDAAPAKIMNMMGMVIMETLESTIDISGLPAGIYMIAIDGNVERFVKR